MKISGCRHLLASTARAILRGGVANRQGAADKTKNKESINLAELARRPRDERLTASEIQELRARGLSFAAEWLRYRRNDSLRNEERFLRKVCRTIGEDSGVAFFVRAEGRLPARLPPGLFAVQLGPLPESSVVNRHDYAAFLPSQGSLTGVDASGRTLIPPEIGRSGSNRTFLLRNATVYGGSGVIRLRDRAAWPNYRWEQSGHGIYTWESVLVEHANQKAVVREAYHAPPTFRLREALSLLDSSEVHFGHFAWGIVPRLRLIVRSTHELGDFPILVGSQAPKSIFEMLTGWGLGNRIVSIPFGESVTVGKLWVPEPLKYFPDALPTGFPHDHKARALALPEFDFLFSAETGRRPTGRAVSLLRHGTGESNWRKCLNPEEINEALVREKVEDLSAHIRSPKVLFDLLRGASTIVVDDGSISANLLLAGVRNARIIFLTHPGVSDGGHLPWWTQGYLASQGNEVISIHLDTSGSLSRTSDWFLNCEDLIRELRSEPTPPDSW